MSYLQTWLCLIAGMVLYRGTIGTSPWIEFIAGAWFSAGALFMHWLLTVRKRG